MPRRGSRWPEGPVFDVSASVKTALDGARIRSWRFGTRQRPAPSDRVRRSSRNSEQLLGQTVTSYMPWRAFGLIRRQSLVLATDQRFILRPALELHSAVRAGLSPDRFHRVGQRRRAQGEGPLPREEAQGPRYGRARSDRAEDAHPEWLLRSPASNVEQQRSRGRAVARSLRSSSSVRRPFSSPAPAMVRPRARCATSRAGRAAAERTGLCLGRVEPVRRQSTAVRASGRSVRVAPGQRAAAHLVLRARAFRFSW